MSLTFGSLCSGIEAASCAWNPLGWKCAFVSEIEPFPCALLKHHYPEVPNYGDMLKFQEWPRQPIDVLVGGTPCQDFSVAGQRAGMGGARGGLTMRFLDCVGAYAPTWIVWENVPGVLSIDGGRAFGAFLGGLASAGMGSPTAFWTLNTPVWPNDASVCSLSDVLEETGSVPQRFFLTPRACAGILRRAAKRGKELPPQLKAALEEVARITSPQAEGLSKPRQPSAPETGAVADSAQTPNATGR